ncbi:hypothetical protein [Paenibacillus arenilitoris]|uniref:Uncharacterized protein n=1 Tax=Paenibacillus arenilitoris TaxID=2772299 RepID=A0A927CGE1_9BACL|nr:hypothetical protein [Paenibacillus arenilitoris]MBD2866994.1 hypothetical protein [Paenibacillus arenilitoris]
MIILNMIMVLICMGLLYTLRMMRDIFRPIELIMYYMVIVIAIEQIHSAFLDNFSLLEFSETFSAYFFYKMNQLIVFPIATMWLLFSFFHSRTRFILKMLFLGLWFSGLVGSYLLFPQLGILKELRLTFGDSLVVWYVVLVESFCFSLLFRKMLGKRDKRDIVPS